MKLSWLCALIVVLGACCCRASATEGEPDPRQRQAMDRKSGRSPPPRQWRARWFQVILAVGNNAAIRKLAGPDTRIIDLGGRLLLPGFNDSHVHFLIGGGSLITVHTWHSQQPGRVQGARRSIRQNPAQRCVASQWPLGSSTLESRPFCPTTS